MKKTMCDFCGETMGEQVSLNKTVKDVRLHSGKLMDITFSSSDVLSDGYDICFTCYAKILLKVLHKVERCDMCTAYVEATKQTARK